MGHSHSHGSGGHSEDRAVNKRRLAIVLALTTTFTVVEVVGALITGSLALLADAGHMLSDDLSLGMALGAIWLAQRPPSPNRSFGYQRAEILAAFLNGLTLVGISIWILIEAYGRFSDPPEVLGGGMLAVAGVGLLINIAGTAILVGGETKSLNVSAALRHLIADLLGSIGVIVAAVIVLATGWLYADPLISVLIALLIAGSAWPVIRDSVRVLIEEAPKGLDADEVGRAMVSVPNVEEIHDLHLWEVTSGFPALAAHALVKPEADCHEARREIEQLLAERFKIEHSTLQVDHCQPKLLQIEGSGTVAATNLRR